MTTPLLTTGEVAEVLKPKGGVRAVQRLIRLGELAAYRVAGEYRISQAALDEYLQNNAVTT
jgi:excisionase family DNA binding protein